MGPGRAQQRAGLKALGRAREARVERADFGAGGVVLQQVLVGSGRAFRGLRGREWRVWPVTRGREAWPASSSAATETWGAAPTRRVRSSAARGAHGPDSGLGVFLLWGPGWRGAQGSLASGPESHRRYADLLPQRVGK